MDGSQTTDITPSASDRYLVPAVEQALRILTCLAESDAPQMSLLDICSVVGIHKSKAFSILHTLHKYSLVQKNDRKKGYALGPGLIALCSRFLKNMDVRKLAEPILEELATKGGGTAALGLIDGEYVTIAAKFEGVRGFGIITNHIGQRFPLTHGSAGKAIAATLPEEALHRLLQRKELYFHGDPQQLNRVRLVRELAQTRKLGYAQDIGDIIPKINAVAAAVIGKDHKAVGYIILFGLFDRDRLKDLGPLVAQSAQTLSKQMGFLPEGGQDHG